MRLPVLLRRLLIPALLLLSAAPPVSALPAERDKGDWRRRKGKKG